MTDDTLAMIMAGGTGERLKPLTDVRAKPAVPFGGIFRIVDFTISNCINSGVRQIYVLTQYKSHSLTNHLKSGWNFLSRRLDQFIDEVPAQMQLGNHWYNGTADAIRQNFNLIDHAAPRLVLVLSGDHIYKMDYRLLRRFHEEKKAELTVAVVRVPADEARRAFGVLELDAEDRIVGFEEKPAQPKCIPGTSECMASMGIYAFDYTTLKAALEGGQDDFGKHVIPAMISAGKPVFGYDFSTRNTIAEYEYQSKEGQRLKELTSPASDSSYWRDVGTLDAFWLANLDLVAARPKFNIYSERWPVFNCPTHFPPAKFVHEGPGRTGMAVDSIIADGVIISGSTVRRSVLSNGVYVHSYAVVESSVLMGGSIKGGLITETSIGRSCKVRNAIIDKNAKLNEGTVIGYDRAGDEKRGLKTQSIAGTDDYLVVVPKDATV